MNYCCKIWESRYLWSHLSLSDLRSRWRRSFFGIFWSILQPLCMTLLLSFVFSRLFKKDITSYAPYILSGMLIWEFIVSSVISGSLAFVQADAYIKQCNHPLAIYTLRTILTNLIVLMLASLNLIGWILIFMPKNLNCQWFSALLIFPCIVLITWPLTTLIAYIATRFRDLQHALGLVFQAMWFFSPIYFEESFFRNGNLDILLDYNPVYHLLELVRAPLLKGHLPTLENYIYCLSTILGIIFLAWIVGRKMEKGVIFYL